MNELLKVPEAAKVLACSPGHVYQLIRQGLLPAVSLGPHTLRISRRALDRYIAEQEAREPVVQPSIGRLY